MQDPADPQTLNRYAYVRNNPVNLVDPSGHFWEIFVAIISWVISIAVAAVSANSAARQTNDSGSSGGRRSARPAPTKTWALKDTGKRFYRTPPTVRLVADTTPPPYTEEEIRALDVPIIEEAMPLQILDAASWLAGFGVTAKAGWTMAKAMGRGAVQGLRSLGEKGAVRLGAGVPKSRALIPRNFETLAPDGGFLGGFRTPEKLRPGTLIDRFGSRRGSFASPAGTPFSKRGLPPEAAARHKDTLKVMKPLDVEGGIAAHAFGGGGGVQYKLPKTVQELIDAGVLEVK